MKTFIRRLGNKSRYLNQLLIHVPSNYDTYIEPFVGSGALFLRLRPQKWIINDTCNDIMNVWCSVKTSHIQIISSLIAFSKVFINLSRDQKTKTCRELLQLMQKLPFDTKRAVLFIILTYCVYAGSIIKNNQYYFTGLDLSLSKTAPIYFLSDKYFKNLNIVQEFLITTTGRLYNKDYTYILKKAKQNDFVFLDPPYVEMRRTNVQYNINELIDENFLLSFASEVDKLNDKGVKFLITQPDVNIVRELFAKYNIKTFEVYRRYRNGFDNELIITNY